jgi:hypothetical protein
VSKQGAKTQEREMKFLTMCVMALSLGLAACDDATVVSSNISSDADNFKILRRIVFYNGINGEYMMTLTGYCSQVAEPKKLAVTCKTPDGYKKHFLGLSDNVTYFSEQLNPAQVSPNFYKVVWKPLTMIPDIEIR